jgi:hypothetical protein
VSLERDIVARATPPEAESRAPKAGRAPFVLGANLPWLQYGCDFGANAWQPEGGVGRPEQRERLRHSFARLAERGLTTVRWFVLGDGRAGVRFDAPGLVGGLDEVFWRDLEAGLEEASRAGIVLVPVLFDFRWCRRARTFNGVRGGGHRKALAAADASDALVERLVVPILRRCAGSSSIAAWDVINEPEWATWGLGAIDPFGAVSRRAMRRFIGLAVSAVHAGTRQPATVGLASWRGFPLVRGLGLDVWQVHWYDRRERRSPLGRPVSAEMGLPVWLGEFPTAGSRKSPEEIIATAQRAGYAAALAWSAEAVDRYSDLGRLGGTPTLDCVGMTGRTRTIVSTEPSRWPPSSIRSTR